jgi:hypothetical protein
MRRVHSIERDKTISTYLERDFISIDCRYSAADTFPKGVARIAWTLFCETGIDRRGCQCVRISPDSITANYSLDCKPRSG